MPGSDRGGVLETHLVVNIVQPLVALLLKRIVRNGIKGGAGHRHISGVGGKFQIALLLGEPAQEHGGGFGLKNKHPQRIAPELKQPGHALRMLLLCGGARRLKQKIRTLLFRETVRIFLVWCEW